MFSSEDRIFIIQKWYETRSIMSILRALRHRYLDLHGKDLPAKSSIHYVIKPFKRTGSVTDRGRSYTAPTGPCVRSKIIT